MKSSASVCALLLAGCSTTSDDLMCPVDVSPEIQSVATGVDWRDLDLDTTVPRHITVALVSDSSFARLSGDPDPEGTMLEEAVAVQGLYHEQLGVLVEVVHLEALNAAEDPFLGSQDDRAEALYEFREWFAAERGDVDCDVATLTTRRRIGVSGVATPSTICYRRGYAVSRGADRMIYAHEWGHILGMGHDPRGGTQDDPRYVMAPSLSRFQSFEFSKRSEKHFASRLLDPRVSCLSPPIETGAPFVRGDTDGDGRVSFSDFFPLIAHVRQGPGRRDLECEDAGDVNDDGIIDIRDLVRLGEYLQGGDEPAFPFPEAGTDPTSDLLGCQP